MLSDLVTGALLAGVAVVLWWTADRSTRPGVDVERSPGLRLPITLSSRTAWLAAHHRIARTLRASAIATLTAASVHVGWAAAGTTGPGDVVVLTWLVASVPVVIHVVVVGQRAARRSEDAQRP